MADVSGISVTGEIDRVDETGHAVLDVLDDCVDVGTIPKTEGDVTVDLEDSDSRRVRGRLRVEALESPLTLVPTDSSTTILHDESETPTATLLDLGEADMLLSEPVPVGRRITVAFDDPSGPLIQADLKSTERTKETGDEREESLDIEALVDTLGEFDSSAHASTPGRTSREKYTCKCCGTRADSGQHQCSLCVEAGCRPQRKRCQFH